MCVIEVRAARRKSCPVRCPVPWRIDGDRTGPELLRELTPFGMRAPRLHMILVTWRDT